MVCVDKVAASGGYMMACMASELVAAPFAMLGSIGVLGPTRMDYPAALATVEAVSDRLGRRLSDGGNSNG